MKILVVSELKHINGVTLYRKLSPHVHLAERYDEVYVDFNTCQDELTDELIKDVDLVVMHINYFTVNLIEWFKSKGLPVIMDVDDYWKLPQTNPHYGMHQKKLDNGMTVEEQKQYALGLVDGVTCTTEFLAKKIAPFNLNVCVLPNAINTAFEMYEVNPHIYEDSLFRFGYFGGQSHLYDIRDMAGAFTQLPRYNIKDKYRVVYATRGGDDPMSAMYHFLFTAGGMHNDRVEVLPLAPAMEYCRYYNLVDAVLIPLQDTEFNSCKSEMKLIEAGHFRKAAIVSDVNPYRPLLKHKENCLIVRKPSDWFKHMDYLLNNPMETVRLGNNLHRTIKEAGYYQDAVAPKRYNFYKEIIDANR